MIRMKRKFVLIVVLLITLFLSACDVSGGMGNKVSAETLNHISTVVMNGNIKISTTLFEIKNNSRVELPYRGYGSGVIIKIEEDENSTYYYILTNFHVIDLGSKLLEEEHDEEAEYEYLHELVDVYGNIELGEVVYKNKEDDLALIKMISYAELYVVELAEENPAIYDMVFSIGSPENKSNVVTAGKIVGYPPYEKVSYNIISHKAYIFRGSSGSMLINEDYKLVGLNTWGLNPKDKDINDGFERGGAIPILIIHDFLEEYFK